MSGINLSDQLEGNIRLLLHRDSDVRERVQANLKCLLSQEPNSHCRLPRFHQIVQTDLAKFFLNLKVHVRKKLLKSSTSLSARDCDLLTLVLGTNQLLIMTHPPKNCRSLQKWLKST